MDGANEANKMFIIWLHWLFQFWKGDRELEVRMDLELANHVKSREIS